jgi:hypothetical protein
MSEMLQQLQKELNIPSFSFKAKETGEQLAMSVFNGRVRFSVFPPKGSNARGLIFNQALQPSGLILLKEMLAGYDTMTPDSRKNIMFMDWDQDAKQAKPKASLIFGQDEKQNFYFELQFKHNDNNKVIRFGIMAGVIAQPSSEFSFADKSKLQVRTMIDWIETIVPVAICLTGSKFKPGGGGNNGQRY